MVFSRCLARNPGRGAEFTEEDRRRKRWGESSLTRGLRDRLRALLCDLGACRVAVKGGWNPLGLVSRIELNSVSSVVREAVPWRVPQQV